MGIAPLIVKGAADVAVGCQCFLSKPGGKSETTSLPD